MKGLWKLNRKIKRLEKKLISIRWNCADPRFAQWASDFDKAKSEKEILVQGSKDG